MTSKHSTARSSQLAIIALLAAVVLAPACQSGQGGSADAKRSARDARRQVEKVAWDADEVTRLTAQLSEQMTAVRQSIRLEPGIQEQVRMQSKAAVRLTDLLRVLEKSSRQLASRVAGGGGLEETLPVVRKIGSLLRSARVQGRSLMITEPSLEVIEQARATLKELGPFYGVQLDPAESSA